MKNSQPYPIGTPGEKWGNDEKTAWLAVQKIKRSYADEVVAKLEGLKQRFKLETYGALSISAETYPLYVLKTRDWGEDIPNILITGGVHGYETSGVQGAIRFLQTEAQKYERQFNFMVAPCVSPWPGKEYQIPDYRLAGLGWERCNCTPHSSNCRYMPVVSCLFCVRRIEHRGFQ